VAEGARLESVFTRKGNVGSNPTLSASFQSTCTTANHNKSRRFREGQANYFRVGLSHLVCDHVSVDVEHGVRMPHELLLNGNRSSNGVQPRAVAVAQ
jgi:hypothetical protein